MSPRQQVRIGRRRIDRLQEFSHDERANLKIQGIHVRGRTGEMTKASIGIAAGERPGSRLVDRLPAVRAVGSQLPQHEDGVEARMAVPGGRIEQPASVRFLVVHDTVQDLFRPRRGFVQQAIVVHHVKGGGDTAYRQEDGGGPAGRSGRNR